MHPCNFKNINSTTRPAFCEDFITVTSTKGFLEYILIVLVAFLVLTLLENNLPCKDFMEIMLIFQKTS